MDPTGYIVNPGQGGEAMGLPCSSLQPGYSSLSIPLCHDYPIPHLLASEPLELSPWHLCWTLSPRGHEIVSKYLGGS